jgi:hypothetical protein
MNHHEGRRVMTMRRSAKAAPTALDMFWRAVRPERTSTRLTLGRRQSLKKRGPRRCRSEVPDFLKTTRAVGTAER